MKKINIFQIFSICLILTSSACTDLENKETDSVVGGAGSTAIPAADLLGSVYGAFENYTDQGRTFSLGAHTSAEMIPPTRGTDWGDNGVWRTLDQHNWGADHSFVRDAWNDLNGAAYACNEVLAAPDATVAQKAEAKFLRAFFMWHVMDFWGQVPFRNITDGVTVNPKVLTRSEAYDFIMTDLTDALANLPVKAPAAENRLPSKATCRFMMARMILNKAVYKSTTPAGPYTFNNADMDAVIAAVDGIIADGYTFEPNYFDIWKSTASKESIWTTNKGIGPMRRWNMTTHYNQETGGWNGFATLAEFYDKFSANDKRRGFPAPRTSSGNRDSSGIDYGFLIGQQYKKDGSMVIDNRTNKPLSFTRDIPLAGAATDKGIRVIKYHPVTSASVDFILMRFGEAAMMKIEALVRKGDNAGALVLFNALRTARQAPTVTAVTLNDVFDEIGRELYWEGHKRTAEIRFSKFLTGAGVAETSPKTVLFPIPGSAVVSNPNLKQNEGY